MEQMAEERKGEVEDTIGIYVGKRNAAGERCGEGWAVLPNGDFYRGCYAHGMRNGRGLYVFTRNGARYDGEWRRALKYGVGTMIYPDGSKYEGDWKHDVKQGFGAYYYPNGDIYEGAWFKNKRHGLGTYFYAETKTKFMGTWVEGVIQGPGQIMYPRSRFHGSWTKGVPKGPGCFVFDSNCMQHGFYMLVKDPPLEGSGGEEEEREDRDYQTMAGEGDDEEDETLGKVAVWRVRNITAYMAELLPPDAVPLPVYDSIPSMTDVSVDTCAMPFEPPSVVGEEEASIDGDSWLIHRQQFLEEAEIGDHRDPSKVDTGRLSTKSEKGRESSKMTPLKGKEPSKIGTPKGRESSKVEAKKEKVPPKAKIGKK